MKEIISIHFGNAGINIGRETQELMAIEHGIAGNGTLTANNPNNNLDAFYQAKQGGGVQSRSFFMGSESEPFEDIRASPYRDLFKSNHMLSQVDPSSSLHARARYTTGREGSDEFREVIRVAAEKADSLQGFLVYSGVGGGDGSGLLNQMMPKLLQDFENKSHIGVFLLPGENPAYHTSVLEAYNSILSVESLKKMSLSIFLDNDSVAKISARNNDKDRDGYSNLNRLIAQFVSGMTLNMRFKGSFNTTLKDLKTRLIDGNGPWWVVPSITPFGSQGQSLDAQKLTDCLTDTTNWLVDTEGHAGVLGSGELIYRGAVSQGEAQNAIGNQMYQMRQKTSNWCLDKIQPTFGTKANEDWAGSTFYKQKSSCVGLQVTSALSVKLSRIAEKFDNMYAKRAHVHWYVGEGMEEGEFNEARTDWAQVIGSFDEMSQKEAEHGGSM